MKFQTLRIWLACLWLAFTTAMVIWWWSLGLAELRQVMVAENHSKYRMLMWEGGFFLVAILLGGGFLIFLLFKDFERQKQVKLFFSTFSHDLKTSISRLRLQTDILREERPSHKNPNLDRLAGDINRLDLQLENSLILSQGLQELFIEERLALSQFIEALRAEWENLEISLAKEAYLRGDRRALLSLFRNLFQNAVIHGGATKIQISVKSPRPGRLEISLTDNGRGYQGDTRQLGLNPLGAEKSSGHGIGLFLCRSLLKRQKGKLSFKNGKDSSTSESRGFVAIVSIPGVL